MTGAAGQGGAVAIWHDIVPEGLDEFYAWHGEEHMPERVSIPGFLRGRRYVAIEADLRWFNLYETESPEVVRGPAYKARLDSPTPRTLSAVRHFRHVARALCAVIDRHGFSERGMTAQGGLIATLRYDTEEASEAEAIAALRGTILPALAGRPGLAAVSLLRADRAASGYVNAEQRARGAANSVPPLVLLVEGWADDHRFVAAMRDALGPQALRAAGLEGAAALGIYRHELTVTDAAAAAPAPRL